MIKYEYIYIEEKKRYYVPRAGAICQAMKRDVLFEKFLGISPVIVNPKTWDILKEENKVKYLEV